MSSVPPTGPGLWSVNAPPQADLPRTYPQLLRGPRYAPWRGLLAILMAVGIGGAAVIVISIIAFVVVLLTGSVDLSASTDVEGFTAQLYDDPVIFLANNLGLAAFIPAAGLSVWACCGWRPRWVSSVVPGIRWTWLVVSFLVCLPFHAAFMAWSMSGEPVTWQLDGKAITLVVIVLLTTPLQAAGEEYMFRGVLTQAIGSWFGRPLAAVLTSALVSGVLFAAVHSLGGEQDVWLFLGRFFVGLLFSYLVWLTGGLEAAISAHAVNNMVIMVPMALTGGLGAAITAGESSAASALLDLALIVVLGAVLTFVALRMKVQQVHDPAAQPGGRRPAMPDFRPELPGSGHSGGNAWPPGPDLPEPPKGMVSPPSEPPRGGSGQHRW